MMGIQTNFVEAGMITEIGKGNQVCPRFIKRLNLNLNYGEDGYGYVCKVDIEKF